MTPDEQPQPVAWYCTHRGKLTPESEEFGEDFIATNPAYVKMHPDHNWKPLYAHPPTSAASQPDAVRVTTYDGTLIIEAGNAAIFVACAGDAAISYSIGKPYGHQRILDPEQEIPSDLIAALNPPARSAARGDVPNATPKAAKAVVTLPSYERKMVMVGDSGRYPDGSSWGHCSSKHVIQIDEADWYAFVAAISAPSSADVATPTSGSKS